MADTTNILACVRETYDRFKDRNGILVIRSFHSSRGSHAPYEAYCDNADSVCDIVNQLDAKPGYQIYMVLNEVSPEFLKGKPKNTLCAVGGVNSNDGTIRHIDKMVSDNDICRRRWILIDFDPGRPSGVSSTDIEKDSAQERCEAVWEELKKAGFRMPFLADSGNGYHLLFPIDLPNDEHSKHLVVGLLKKLHQEFSDDAVIIDTSVSNAARICKLYGTFAKKGNNTPERPHRQSMMKSKKTPILLDAHVIESFIGANTESSPERPQITNGADDSPLDAQQIRSSVEELIERLETALSGKRIPHDYDNWLKGAMLIGLIGRDGADLFDRYNALWENARISEDHDRFLTDFCINAKQEKIGVSWFCNFVEGIENNSEKKKDIGSIDIGFPLLPTWVSVVVDVVCKSIDAPRNYIIVALLCAISACVLKKVRSRVGGFFNYPQLYAVFCDPPSYNKSWPLRFFLEPIMKEDADLYKQNEQAYREWEKNGKEGEPPREHLLISMDCTPEKIISLLKDNPNGFTNYTDEFSGFLQNLERYHQGNDLQNYIDSYDNRPIKVQRKGERTTLIPEAMMNLFGTIQPDVLRTAIRKNPNLLHSGFLYRFIWVHEPNYRIPDARLSDVENDVKSIWERKAKNLRNLPLIGDVELSPEATEMYLSYKNGHIREYNQGKASPMLQSILGKCDIICLRLATLAFVLKCEERHEQGHPFSPSIDLDCMKFAVGAMRYFEHTARVVFRCASAEGGTAKEAISQMLKVFPDLNQSKLAESIGMTQAYVSTIRKGIYTQVIR